MKITKKLIALVMVASLAISGCGKKVTAEEVLQKSVEKQKAITAMDADTTVKMTMQAEGQTMDMNMDVNVKAKDITSESMTMLMDGNMTMLGQEMPVKTFYKDGYQYTDSMGQKIKMAMPYEEMLSMANQNSTLSEIPMDAYKTLEMKKVDAGYELTFVADGTKVTELVDELLGSTMGESIEGTEMTVKDINGTTVVDKDFNVLDMTMKLEMTMTVEGQEMSCVMDMVAKYNAYGENVTIEEPADLDQYMDEEEAMKELENMDLEDLEGLEDIDLEGLDEEVAE